MNRFAVLALLLTSSPALGQAPEGGATLRGQSEQTYKRLAEAERKLLDGKAAEAAEAVQRVIDEAGDDLVAPPDRPLYRPARQVAQVILAKLPPDALKAYRLRADEPARKLLEAGKKARNPRPLRELLGRYFASRPAEEALLLLGDLAFERGEFRAAEGYWRRLLPGRSEDPAAADGPSFPDPRTPPAVARARVALAAIFEGEPDRARQELARLKADAPTASGHLAGRDGPFVQTLQALLDRPPVLAADRGDGEWTAFAGSMAHDGRAGGRLPYYWPSRPSWRAPIPRDRGPLGAPFPQAGSVKAVAFHPVVLDGVAYVADPRRVFGFDLLTGMPRFAYDLRRDRAARELKLEDVTIPFPHEADFTLTAADGRLFARLGAAEIALPNGGAGPLSFLVGFAPPAEPKPGGPPLEAAWTLAPPVAAGTAATWEGAPVWSAGRLYAAFARFDGTRAIHAIACYDEPPDRPVWVTEVCDAPQPPEPRYRHEPLTLAGGNVVFCSHTGVLAAVDARTGKPAWAVRYPKAARPPATGSPRDLCPPLADRGRVFAAPADSDQVLALDAHTGRELWRAGPIQVDQLLGVTRGRLVCTIAAPNRGIRGLGVVNGSDREPDGWAVHDDPLLRSFGRGLVSDELVLWPTRAGLFLLSPEDGLPLRPPALRVEGPTFGNLAFAGGVLLVATPTELWGYVSDRAELPQRRAAAAARPGDPEAARKLALALADAGRWDEAEKAIRAAEPAADVPRVRAEWLADRAERALLTGRPDEARSLLRRGLGEEFPPDWRHRAAARLLTLEPASGGPEAAGKFLAGLRQPAGFDAGWVPGPDGVPVRLRDLAARHFGVTPRPPPAPGKSTPRPAAEFDPTQAHRLGPGTTVGRETVFPSERCVPLLPFDGPGLPGLGPEAGNEPRLLVTDGRRVLAYRPGEGKPAWEAPLPAGITVTHAAVAGDSVIAAGPRGAVRLKLADGGLAWSFALPDADPLPGPSPQPMPRSAGVPWTLPGLSDFALAGPRLVARVGEHALIALDTASGDVAWALDASDRRRLTPFPFDGSPGFARPYFADADGVIVQLTTGRRWTIDPLTGQVGHVAPTAGVPWDGPPVRMLGGRVAVPDGPGLVRGFDPRESRQVWAADFGGEASLTGRPPRLRAAPDGVLVAVSRNHGVELHRRFAAGSAVWRDGVLLPVGEIDPSAADGDLGAVYLPAEGKLFALRLADGRLAWVADLSAQAGGWRGNWRVRVGRQAVVAYPASPVAADPLAGLPARATESFAATPAVSRLPGLAAGLYDAWAGRSVPVLFLDPETGQVRHRLDLPATGPALSVHLGRDHAVVATAGKAYWLK